MRHLPSLVDSRQVLLGFILGILATWVFGLLLDLILNPVSLAIIAVVVIVYFVAFRRNGEKTSISQFGE